MVFEMAQMRRRRGPIKTPHFPGPPKHTANSCGETSPKTKDSCCGGLLFGVPRITPKSLQCADHGFFWHWFDSSGLCDLCPVHSSRQCVASQGGDMDEKWGALLGLYCADKKIHAKVS